jgi:hypothetical protein
MQGYLVPPAIAADEALRFEAADTPTPDVVTALAAAGCPWGANSSTPAMRPR